MMELSSDDTFAEYCEVSSVSNSASVRAVCDGGCEKSAFCDRCAALGKICRVAFKAIQSDTSLFTLHIPQAADSEPKKLTDFSDYSLGVKLAKDDVAASPTSTKASSTSFDKSSSFSRSSLSVRSDIEEDKETLGSGVFLLAQ